MFGNERWIPDKIPDFRERTFRSALANLLTYNELKDIAQKYSSKSKA